MAVLTKERWLFSLNTLAFHLLNKTRISQQQNSFLFSHQNWERGQLFAVSLASCIYPFSYLSNLKGLRHKFHAIPHNLKKVKI